MAPKKTLDKRDDLYSLLSMAWFWSACSGVLNVVTIKELGGPVGYTSGHSVTAGRALASRDGTFTKIFGILTMYCVGGVLTGIAPGICDGDAVFEGRTSYGLVAASMLIPLGMKLKRLGQPLAACWVLALSQGLLNAVTSSCSAAPIRTTHVAGGQTDASIIIGKSVSLASRGQKILSLRKVFLNFLGTFGMGCGGFLAEFLYKVYGLDLALVPAGAILASGTVFPALVTPPKDEDEEKTKAA